MRPCRQSLTLRLRRALIRVRPAKAGHNRTKLGKLARERVDRRTQCLDAISIGTAATQHAPPNELTSYRRSGSRMCVGRSSNVQVDGLIPRDRRSSFTTQQLIDIAHEVRHGRRLRIRILGGLVEAAKPNGLLRERQALEVRDFR